MNTRRTAASAAFAAAVLLGAPAAFAQQAGGATGSMPQGTSTRDAATPVGGTAPVGAGERTGATRTVGPEGRGVPETRDAQGRVRAEPVPGGTTTRNPKATSPAGPPPAAPGASPHRERIPHGSPGDANATGGGGTASGTSSPNAGLTTGGANSGSAPPGNPKAGTKLATGPSGSGTTTVETSRSPADRTTGTTGAGSTGTAPGAQAPSGVTSGKGTQRPPPR